MYNKHQNRIISDKKTLCKISKRWKTVSIAALMAISGTAFASHISHASNINNNNDNSTKKIINQGDNNPTATLVKTDGTDIDQGNDNIVNDTKIPNIHNNEYNYVSDVKPLAVPNSRIDLNSNEPSSTSKYIRANVVVDPSVYVNSLLNSGNFSSQDRDAISKITNNPSVKKYINFALINKRSVDIQNELQSISNELSKSILPALSSVSYTRANWSVYKGIATSMLYGALPSNLRPDASTAFDEILSDPNIIDPSTKNSLINSVENMVSTLNSAISVVGNLSEGMTVKIILNPDNPANQHHGIVPKSNDPNDWMAYDNNKLIDPLFNQNYHYNVPMGAANDIQSIIPHYNSNGGIDYWDVYYLWNPNIEETFGNSWYHARTKNFRIFYPGNNVKDSKSIQNAAIPDPQIKYNGKPADIDTAVNRNGIPWGYVAAGSVIYNDSRANGRTWLTQDQWGNPIAPDAKLAWFSTFSDHTTPDDGIYLAYSNDNQQFHPYRDSPVMTTKNVNLPDGSDFRDADVTTCNQGNELVAYVAGGENQKIYVLTSRDGINWQYRHDLNINLSRIPDSLKGASPYTFNSTHNAIVETPNVKTINGQTILFFGCQPKGDDLRQYEDIFYIPGRYNQEGIFQPSVNVNYGSIDQGLDNYAGNFTKIDANHSVYVGWLGNWQYSPILDYSAYQQGGSHQGTTTLPRVLSWNGKSIESDPIEPGQEVPIEKAYLIANNQLPVTSNGKVVVQFNQSVNHFNINLSRSSTNHITMTFNNGSLYIDRHDAIHANMNMNKTIRNVGINRLDGIDFYIDNDSVEAYVPQIHQFYTLLDLDYHHNAPYTMSLDESAQINEYRFNTSEPQSIPDDAINGIDLERLNDYMSQFNITSGTINSNSSNAININLDDINNLINLEKQYIIKVNEYKYNNDQRSNIYIALSNDVEEQIQEKLNRVADQLKASTTPVFVGDAPGNYYKNNSPYSAHYFHNGFQIRNAFIADHGVVYHVDGNGNFSRNTDLTVSPNITYHFNNRGQGEAVPFQNSPSLASPIAYSPTAKFIGSFVKTLHQIASQPVAKRAFDDLLNRINTNNLPNLETGVPGIPPMAFTFSTDAQSPFVHQLLKHLSNDMTSLGKSIDVPLLIIAGNVCNTLLKNIWGVGFLAGGPFNFKRVINNLLPNPNFKALTPYKTYIQDAELIYNNPKSVSSYDDIIYQIGEILDGFARPSDVGRQIAEDFRQIGLTSGLPSAVSTYFVSLANGIDDMYYRQPMQDIDAKINFASDVMNYDNSLVASVQNQGTASVTVSADRAKVSTEANQADNDLKVINNSNYQSLRSCARDASYAVSDAEQSVILANSLAKVQSSSASEEFDSDVRDDANKVNYDMSLINTNFSQAVGLENQSAKFIISSEQNLISDEALSASNDFNMDDLSSATNAVSLANHSESLAYSAYYSASASTSNHNAAIARAYADIYNDQYEINYENNMVNQIRVKVSTNPLAKVIVNSDQEIILDALQRVSNDFNDPLHKFYQADFDVNTVNDALSHIYNVYYDFLNHLL